MKNNKTVVIFGSSKPSPGDIGYDEAYELGKLLASNGYKVCNGGYAGTMHGSAKGAKDAGGYTIGVTAKIFNSPPNEYIDDEIKPKNLFGRLEKLIEIADAYVVLRGGSGTLVELSIAVELMLKGIIKQRPIVLLGEYFKPVVELIREESKNNPKSYPISTLGTLDDFLEIAVTPSDAARIIEERIKKK